MPSYREIFVSSPDPFERGLQHGKQASEEIKQVIAGYQQLFLKEMGYLAKKPGGHLFRRKRYQPVH